MQATLAPCERHVTNGPRRTHTDRKTWMFVGHDVSAQRAAAALTIITTCRKLGLDPRQYIRNTLRRLLAGEKDLSALLPENFKSHLADSGAAADRRAA